MPITRQQKTTSSVESSNGRYVQGGTTDIFRSRLGWWERRTFPRAQDDITVTVTASTAGRPDLIAYDIYEKANLQWFVLQYNNIVDINTEVVVGAKLLLPTPERLNTVVLTRSAGGNRIS